MFVSYSCQAMPSVERKWRILPLLLLVIEARTRVVPSDAMLPLPARLMEELVKLVAMRRVQLMPSVERRKSWPYWLETELYAMKAPLCASREDFSGWYVIAKPAGVVIVHVAALSEEVATRNWPS